MCDVTPYYVCSVCICVFFWIHICACCTLLLHISTMYSLGMDKQLTIILCTSVQSHCPHCVVESSSEGSKTESQSTKEHPYYNFVQVKLIARIMHDYTYSNTTRKPHTKVWGFSSIIFYMAGLVSWCHIEHEQHVIFNKHNNK